jgi:hypothetical protein
LRWGRYAFAMTSRRARWFFITSTAARTSNAMLPLALVADVRITTGSFTTAGTALAVFAVVSSVLAPQRGRVIDRRGPAALAVLALGYTLVLAAVWLVGGLGGGQLGAVVLSGVAGAFAPPVAAYARSVIGEWFAAGEQRDAAFALDSALGELALVTGPVIVGGLLALTPLGVALVTTGAVAFVGSVAMGATAARPVRRTDMRRSAVGFRRLLSPFVLLLGLGTSLGVLDVAIPALAQADGSLGHAGLLLAALAVGSVTGGLVYGAHEWSISAETRCLLAAAVFALVLGALALVVASQAAVAGLLFVAGAVLQPAMIALYMKIQNLAGAGRVTETFAFVTTFSNGGTALGSVVAGSIVQAGHISTAFLVGASIAAASVLILTAIMWRRPPVNSANN